MMGYAMRWALIAIVAVFGATSAHYLSQPARPDVDPPVADVMGPLGPVAQQDPNGFPPEYEPGKFCTPAGNIVNGVQTSENPCSCHRVVYEHDCEGPAHDNNCKQACHEEKHCACPVACAMPQEPNGDPPAKGP
jgi:hypothetical protein